MTKRERKGTDYVAGFHLQQGSWLDRGRSKPEGVAAMLVVRPMVMAIPTQADRRRSTFLMETKKTVELLGLSLSSRHLLELAPLLHNEGI